MSGPGPHLPLGLLTTQALHRAKVAGVTAPGAEGQEGGARVVGCRGGEPAAWCPGGPPRSCGQDNGAFFMAAMDTHLSLQHSLNHLDGNASNLESGLRCFVFLANHFSCFWLVVRKVSTITAKKLVRSSWKTGKCSTEME